MTCASFRLPIWQYSQPAFTYSEMISANALIKNHQFTLKRLLYKDPLEGPVAFQLFGSGEFELAAATKILTDCGADLIDLNCGCSVPKVRGNGSGSALLMDPNKLYNILSAMRKVTHVPLIAKVRVAINDDQHNLDIAKAIQDAGVDALVVHGRNWKESYGTPCRYDKIQLFVAYLKIPVIGNGDVRCVETLKKMFATGCAGVMVGRAMVGQPWLIGELAAYLQQHEFIAPNTSEIGQIFIDHIAHLIKINGSEKSAVLQARRLAKGYTKQLKNRAHFCSKINTIETFAEFCKLCKEFYIDT